MKNVACSRLGKMLRLDIQKGEEAMKMSEFQKYLRGTGGMFPEKRDKNGHLLGFVQHT